MNQFPGDTEEYFARLRVGRESKGLHVSVIENQMNLSRLERMMKDIFQTIAIEDSRRGISERGRDRQTQREAERQTDRERGRERDRETDTERDRERQRQREAERDRERDRDRERQRERESKVRDDDVEGKAAQTCIANSQQ
jgi:hypothetical protein